MKSDAEEAAAKGDGSAALRCLNSYTRIAKSAAHDFANAFAACMEQRGF